MPKDQYMCQLCANHGIYDQPKKGHKQFCPFNDCECSLCGLNTKRRALDQIERQLKKDGDGPAEPSSPNQFKVPPAPPPTGPSNVEQLLQLPLKCYPFPMEIPNTQLRFAPYYVPNFMLPRKNVENTRHEKQKTAEPCAKSIFRSAELLARSDEH